MIMFRGVLNIRRNFATKVVKNKLNDAKAMTKILSPDHDINYPEINARFLEQSIGGPYHKWATTLEKHPEIKILKRKDVLSTVEKLRGLNYTDDDILNKPVVLFTNYLTLENRHKVLQEAGFKEVNLNLLIKYITVINRTVNVLMKFGYIDDDVNVVDKLCNTFTDINLQLPQDVTLNETMTLKYLREHILSQYLQQRLNMSEHDLIKLWRVYGRVRHRSFQSVQHMIQILEELNFSKERIVKNGFVLYGDPDNVQRIIKEVNSIAGTDIRDIIYKRPKILMSSCDSLLKTLEHVRDYGIEDEAVLRCLEILTLGPDTVLERLRVLNETAEFKVLDSNPRILRLVHYHNKARLRLEYLNHLKVRCASLHILSCGSESFVKFARDGSDRTKGCDIVVYLSRNLHQEESEVRALLSRHPNWCHIPLLHVQQCYEYLLKKKFKNEDIYPNIHILLYPIPRIEDKLSQLQSSEFVTQLGSSANNVFDLSNRELLNLVLYGIEYEYHFTGDGVWTDQHVIQMENFNNILPDFPQSLETSYRYGVKPATKNKL